MADVTVNMGGFDSAPQRAHRAADKTMRTWGFETERRAKMKSPVDTGFNKNTIYTVCGDGSLFVNMKPVQQRPTMPESRYSTRLKKTVKRGSPLASIDDSGQLSTVLGSGSGVAVGMFGGSGAALQGPQVGGLIVVEVRVGSLYGLYLEMGTVRMRARPFLGPAAEETTHQVDSWMTINMKREGF